MGRKSKKKRKLKEERLQSHTQHTPQGLPLSLQAGEMIGPTQPWWKRTWEIFWIGFGAVSVIFGVVTGFLYFAPEMSVQPSEASLSDNPLHTLFVARNDGNINLRNVQFRCRINYAKLSNGNQFKWAETNLYIKQIRRMASHESTTLPCLSFLMLPEPLTIDISFLVEFRPALWMFTKNLHFRFKTIKTPQGFKWVPEVTE